MCCTNSGPFIRNSLGSRLPPRDFSCGSLSGCSPILSELIVIGDLVGDGDIGGGLARPRGGVPRPGLALRRSEGTAPAANTSRCVPQELKLLAESAGLCGGDASTAASARGVPRELKLGEAFDRVLRRCSWTAISFFLRDII